MCSASVTISGTWFSVVHCPKINVEILLQGMRWVNSFLFMQEKWTFNLTKPQTHILPWKQNLTKDQRVLLGILVLKNVNFSFFISFGGGGGGLGCGCGVEGWKRRRRRRVAWLYLSVVCSHCKQRTGERLCHCRD